MRAVTVVAWGAVLASAIACQLPPPDAKDIQARKAYQAAQTINFDSNAEIENIRRRLELTSEPGLIGFVMLINDAGQPIVYTAVKGKITSSGKRLTTKCNVNGGECEPSDEGTYGSSDPYIYFWTPTGQYYQWSGDYLYSDKPFRLSVEPIVLDVNVRE